MVSFFNVFRENKRGSREEAVGTISLLVLEDMLHNTDLIFHNIDPIVSGTYFPDNPLCSVNISLKNTFTALRGLAPEANFGVCP